MHAITEEILILSRYATARMRRKQRILKDFKRFSTLYEGVAAASASITFEVLEVAGELKYVGSAISLDSIMNSTDTLSNGYTVFEKWFHDQY